MSKEPASTAELETGILLARAHVAADVRALKTELSPEHLKERALDAAEKSLEGLAGRAKRRLIALPRTLIEAGKEHPLAAGLVGLSVVLAVWRAARHR